MKDGSRLPDTIIEFILQSDTVWLGSSYVSREEDRERYPSHVGTNARGGRPGFVRVLPSDGRTIVLPDYSGNRLLTSLGNIEASSLAAMTFLDWKTGDLLYTTGIAKNVVGPEAQKIMPRQNVLSTTIVTGFVLIRDALPVRQASGTEVERSPYSPPIKFLAEETPANTNALSSDVQALLIRIRPHSRDLISFTFETSSPVRIVPGQAAVLDFSQLVGSAQYSHMAMQGSEASLNDDRIRTWTISSFRGDMRSESWKYGSQLATQFTLTMREMPHGIVTGALFTIARHVHAKMPQLLEDSRPLKLSVPLVGISGSFTLPDPSTDKMISRRKLLWIAGGIGVTPFLGFLDAMGTLPGYASDYDVVLLLSTREPDVILPIIRDAFPERLGQRPKLKIHAFISSSRYTSESGGPGSMIETVIHNERLALDDGERMSSLVPDVSERLAYLCGPPKFEQMVMDSLAKYVETKSVIREGFNY